MAATASPGSLQAPGNQEITDSTTVVGVICAVDAGNYAEVSVHITSSGTSSVATFQCSNDNVNWVGNFLQTSTSVGGLPQSAAQTVGVWRGALMGRYFRINVTGISAGTTTAVIELVPTARTPTALAATVAGSGNFTTLPANATPFDLNAAATTNATSVKATAGNLYGIVLTNVTAAAKFVKLYNKATAPTVGTDVPVATFALGVSSGAVTYPLGSQGMRFSAGIALAITGALPVADATAVAAGDVQVHLDYI